MRKFILFAAAMSLIAMTSAVAGEKDAVTESSEKPAKILDNLKIKPYGFFRMFYAFDTRESSCGTQDLYYYMPKDENLNYAGDDLNEQTSFRFLALTSRLGLDLSGYQYGNAQFGGKFETDFYCMSGNVAVLRLRQAYFTAKWANLGKNGKSSALLKVGQAWHPLSDDKPHGFELEVGQPFCQFSRTPQVSLNYETASGLTFIGSLLWQMQYLSTGPDGKSRNYINYGCTPEVFLGIGYKTGRIAVKAGADLLSIKPKTAADPNAPSGETNSQVKVNDRLTTLSPFLFLQYTHNLFQLRAKTIYASAGEHLNMLSGYGVSSVNSDGSCDYTPMRSSVSFLSAQYGKKWVVSGMFGYAKLLGTADELADRDGDGLTPKTYYYFNTSGYSNMNSMWRVTPAVTRNWGRFCLGLEYNLTGVQYGTYAKDGCVSSKNGLVEDGLHWVYNHRVLMVTKFTF